MQHNAHPLSIMPEYYFVRVPLASPSLVLVLVLALVSVLVSVLVLVLVLV